MGEKKYIYPRIRPGDPKHRLCLDGILKSSKGLTLLELIMALLILQVALVAFAQFMTKALDYSRRVREVEMAQMLAQAKMEELMLTLSTTGMPKTLSAEGKTILNETPGTFNDLALGQAEDIDPFKWVLEAAPSKTHPKLVELTLHVYVVRTRTTDSMREFFVSDDRERFSYSRAMPDGSIEIMAGKEKLRIVSAVAIP
jgi:type II secretory pathway pseudopilin PulG